MHAAGRGAARPPGRAEVQVHHEAEVIRGGVDDFPGAIAAGGVDHPSRTSHPVDPLPEVIDRETRGQVGCIAGDAPTLPSPREGGGQRIFRGQL